MTALLASAAADTENAASAPYALGCRVWLLTASAGATRTEQAAVVGVEALAVGWQLLVQTGERALPGARTVAIAVLNSQGYTARLMHR